MTNDEIWMIEAGRFRIWGFGFGIFPSRTRSISKSEIPNPKFRSFRFRHSSFGEGHRQRVKRSPIARENAEKRLSRSPRPVLAGLSGRLLLDLAFEIRGRAPPRAIAGGVLRRNRRPAGRLRTLPLAWQKGLANGRPKRAFTLLRLSGAERPCGLSRAALAGRSRLGTGVEPVTPQSVGLAQSD